jgi:hypothetical protein
MSIQGEEDMKQRKSSIKPYVGAAAVMLAASMQQNALALPPIKIGDVDVGTITGYARVHGSWNLNDHPDLDFANPGRRVEGQGELSMLRSSLKLEYVNSNLPYDSKLTVVGRLVKESRTTYLKRLDASPFQVGNLIDNYNSNREAIREAYLDIPFSDRVKFRFGKQQVVWGETDLLQALDLVNPRDLSWRSLFEPEDEEWRKPLIMANLNISVPEAKGALQLLYRPGWDRDSQMGNTLDGFGGRWAAQGSKGVNNFALVPYNYHHAEGDTDDASYGFRWTGVFGQDNISYSLAYYHTLSDNPVLNVSAPALGITPYKGSIGSKATDFSTVGAPVPPGFAFGELILPQIDIIGGSLNAYIQPLDIVLRSELAVTLDKPYNAESALGGAGLPTITEKTTAKFMVGFDKQVPLMDLLGTDSSSFWTVQVFDSWIPGFKVEDKLLDIGSSHLKEHSVTLVSTLGLSYKTNQVQPGIAFAMDTSNGGGVVIPSVNLLYGDHWRLRLDAALFFRAQDGCSTDPANGNGANCTHLFGTFDNNDQVSARLTYQF